MLKLVLCMDNENIQGILHNNLIYEMTTVNEFAADSSK